MLLTTRVTKAAFTAVGGVEIFHQIKFSLYYRNKNHLGDGLHAHEITRLAAEDFPLALATAKILPWPWGESSYRSALADIGSAKGNPWVQDINHRVTL